MWPKKSIKIRTMTTMKKENQNEPKSQMPCRKRKQGDYFYYFRRIQLIRCYRLHSIVNYVREKSLANVTSQKFELAFSCEPAFGPKLRQFFRSPNEVTLQRVFETVIDDNAAIKLCNMLECTRQRNLNDLGRKYGRQANAQITVSQSRLFLAIEVGIILREP